jgi:hypothetical protein
MASEQGRSGLALRITGGRVLLPTGELADTDVVVDGGVIDGLGTAGNGAAWDARGLLVLPGIVDLHGDAFERQIMPRPGVAFPMDVALQETDRQLASNGITTAYHAVTYSWEPGLRGRASVIAILDGLKTARPRLGTDTRFHLRFETYNLDAVDEVEGWLADGTVDLLAFNEHMLPMIRKARRGDTLSVQTGRASMNRADFVALLERLAARENEVPGAIARLAGVARANGIPMASHDDRLADERRDFNQHGCSRRHGDVARQPDRARRAERAARRQPSARRGHHRGARSASRPLLGAVLGLLLPGPAAGAVPAGGERRRRLRRGLAADLDQPGRGRRPHRPRPHRTRPPRRPGADRRPRRAGSGGSGGDAGRRQAGASDAGVLTGIGGSGGQRVVSGASPRPYVIPIRISTASMRAARSTFCTGLIRKPSTPAPRAFSTVSRSPCEVTNSAGMRFGPT